MLKKRLIRLKNNCTKTQYFQISRSSPESAMSSQAASHVMRTTVERIVLHQFTPRHCLQARVMLGWSHEQLSRESGVSVAAIQRFEAGAPLRDVTRLALAFRFEAEGLVFFPGFAPGRGMNIRGTTPDPIERKDYELIE